MWKMQSESGGTWSNTGGAGGTIPDVLNRGNGGHGHGYEGITYKAQDGDDAYILLNFE